MNFIFCTLFVVLFFFHFCCRRMIKYVQHVHIYLERLLLYGLTFAKRILLFQVCTTNKIYILRTMYRNFLISVFFGVFTLPGNSYDSISQRIINDKIIEKNCSSAFEKLKI